MTAPHERGAGTPSGRTERVCLKSVELNEELYVRFLTGLRQMGTHYFKKPGDRKARTHPCYGTKCAASDHAHAYISKWYAVVLCWDPTEQDWREWVLEVTEGLELNLRGEKLPGTEWFVTRSGESGPRSPVSGVKQGKVDPSELGKPCNLETFLKHFFRKQVLPESTTPELPDRPVAETRKGSKPLKLQGRDARRTERPPSVDPETREAFRAAKQRMAAPPPEKAPPLPGHVLPMTNGIGHMPDE